MESPQAAHALRLHARHAKEVLEIGEIGGELRELGMEMGQLSRFDAAGRGGEARGVSGAWDA